MESSNMKNMVILKNLPSNLVEEAIIILKSNKKAKKLEKIDKNNKIEKTENKPKEKDYILKEAEMLIQNYISKIENNNNQKELKKAKVNQKYIRLKKYAYFSSFIIFLQCLWIIIK